MKAPRIMLAAPKSGSGKTMITCGILRALQKLGKVPCAFKCGPDYIDPMFHEQVVKTKSWNLDPFFTDDEMTRYLFCSHAAEGDISVLEGVMGYYDGLGGISTKASAYDLSRMTRTPVVFILDARGMSVSAFALIKGFLDFQPDSRIAGVIFNRMSEGMFKELAPVVEEKLEVHAIGYVPELPECRLSSRHLGLVLPDEVEGLSKKVDLLADTLLSTLDFGKILDLAQGAEELEAEEPDLWHRIRTSERAENIRCKKPVIAVAKDEAFCFLYRDNLSLLEQLGAKLAFFSPLHEKQLPEETAGFLIPGGYPELYARMLSENLPMRTSILEAVRNGMPFLAECGGYMYLSESLEDMEGTVYPMVSAVPGQIRRTKKLCRFGYVELSVNREHLLGGSSTPIRAHEFHYFDSSDNGTDFHAKKPLRKRNWECIHANDHSIAGFPHFYYYNCPEMILDFLEQCESIQDSRKGGIR